MGKHYLVYRKEQECYSFINEKDINGFIFRPLHDECYGISVSKIILIKPEFIERVLKKKIKRKLDLYLEIIMEMFDEDDEWEDPSNLRHALNSLERFKSLIRNNYRIYLEERYLKILANKIALIEKELKQRITYLEYMELEKENKEEELENKRSR